MAKGKKTGGRKKGTPNKATAFSKEVINDILTDYRESGALGKDISQLEPKERLDVMIKLMGFVTPKPQSISMDITSSNSITIEDTLAELAEENDNADV